MKRSDLEHILRASKGVTGETEFVVIGSQAILGSHPDAPRVLRESMEADLYPRFRPELSEVIEGSLGRYSRFDQTFGYFADGVAQRRPRYRMPGKNGWRVTNDFMMDALREEMLARNYTASYQFAFETVSPQQRWEDWLKVNDRIVLEAAAVPAESFLVDVPEPTEAQLAEFFEAHKQREPQPDFVAQMEFPSATPGFAIPRKIDVQYIQANYDRYVEKLEDEREVAGVERLVSKAQCFLVRVGHFRSISRGQARRYPQPGQRGQAGHDPALEEEHEEDDRDRDQNDPRTLQKFHKCHDEQHQERADRADRVHRACLQYDGVCLGFVRPSSRARTRLLRRTRPSVPGPD